MEYNNLGGTKYKIVQAFRLFNGEAVGAKEIAPKAGISVATFYNHIDSLIEDGYVEPAVNYKSNRGRLFVLKGDKEIGYSIVHENQRRTLYSFLENLVLNGIPRDPNEVNINFVIFHLFRLSALQLSDEPVAIKAFELKELQNTLVKTAEHLEKLSALARALLERRRLWNKDELPAALIMEHEGLSIEDVLSIIDRIENSQSQ